VRAVRDAGLPCAVFLAPVLPCLTDSRAALDDALAQAAAAGASSIMYSTLHLKPGVREWFFAWMERERPELLPQYRAMYGGSTYAPKDYRQWLAARIRPLMRKHGLDRASLDPATGTIRSRETLRALGAAGTSSVRRSAVGTPDDDASRAGDALLAAELPAHAAAALQPTLF